MKRIAGVDEAGRGPLAGPVVVAAVVLDPARPIAGLNDSKQLSEARRHALDAEIRARALAFCVIEVGTEAIDRHNILQATLIGMRDALLGLAPAPDEALIDGNKLPKDLPCPAQAIVDGDALVAEISAASILAKVHRDALMTDLDRLYPAYGFAGHKGYGAQTHLAALAAHGPCPEHRHSFAPIAGTHDLFTVAA